METTKDQIAEWRALCEAATPGPWESSEPYSPMITAKDPYGHGMMHVADIRGWGHLTGKGSCDLPEGQACAIQEANSFFIAAARTGWPAALDALEAAYAEIERLTHDYAASAKRLIDEKDRLPAELAAEKRRADAAEKDLYRVSRNR